LEDVAGEEEGDCECDDCVVVSSVGGESVVIVVVDVVGIWG